MSPISNTLALFHNVPYFISAAHHTDRWQNHAMYVGLHFPGKDGKDSSSGHRHKRRHRKHKPRHGAPHAQPQPDPAKPREYIVFFVAFRSPVVRVVLINEYIVLGFKSPS